MKNILLVICLLIVDVAFAYGFYDLIHLNGDRQSMKGTIEFAILLVGAFIVLYQLARLLEWIIAGCLWLTQGRVSAQTYLKNGDYGGWV